MNLIFFTFISFAILGLYDDIMKFFKFKQTGFFGLRMRHKFAIQWILALIVSLLMFSNLSIDIFYVPFIGVFKLGWWFVPLAAFIIVSFTNSWFTIIWESIYTTRTSFTVIPCIYTSCSCAHIFFLSIRYCRISTPRWNNSTSSICCRTWWRISCCCKEIFWLYPSGNNKKIKIFHFKKLQKEKFY